MAEKSWNEMDGWEKTWEVSKVVGSITLFVLSIFLGGKAPRKPRPPTIWNPKFYLPKGGGGPKGWKY